MNLLPSNFLSLSPVLCLSIVTLTVLTIVSLVKKNKESSFWISVIGLMLSLYFSAITLNNKTEVLYQMITVGGFSNYFAMLFIISALLTVVLSRHNLEKNQKELGEFYILILFATLGMMFIASAADLTMIFLGIELMSICLYILAGYFRTKVKSNEAALKYFLLGAFATGFLLYGIALVYGSSGTTNIASIVEKLPALASSKIFWAGIGLLLVGLGFKVAAVPFHMWVPDVYEGAPTTISGFMSTGAKAAAFSALILMFARPFMHGENLQLAFSVIAAASMILGNVVAISQSNIKRMLAYSSIAHAGYMLIGIAAANELGKTGIIFYLTVYTFMNIGAFGILSYFEQADEKYLTFDDYAGLANRKPYLAALMAVFMFSLTGIPPFAGFLGKYYVFVAAINANLTWLAILGVLSSVIGVYYYLRLVIVMYFTNPSIVEANNGSAGSSLSTKLSLAVLTIAALAVIVLGVFPSSILSLIQKLL